MIRNFVFDVGNVLVDFRYRDYMRDLGFSEEAVEFLARNVVQTDFWAEWDRGLHTIAEAAETFAEAYPQYREEIAQFWANIQDIVREYEYARPLLHSLKMEGYGVYLLSNYPVETAEMHWPAFSFLPETDGRIISGYEKLAKPDERIYRLLESRFGLHLSECLFIDDSPVNLEGAKSAGMQTLLFTGIEPLKKDLREKGYF